MDTKDIFANNKKWAQEQLKNDPNFFTSLSKEQKPNYLWIGCSDSRVPTNQIMNLPAGEIFVHRNIANIVAHTDFNCLSAIQYSVEVLKVEHIIVCGHYDCGGVQAAMKDNAPGYVKNWLSNIQNIVRQNGVLFRDLAPEEKCDKVCELNVIEQVKNLKNTDIVKNARERKQKLTIHGWIYDINDGILHDLNIDRT